MTTLAEPVWCEEAPGGADEAVRYQIGLKFRDLAPDVVGTTAITPSIYKAERTLEIAKQAVPGVFTMLGGVHGFAGGLPHPLGAAEHRRRKTDKREDCLTEQSEGVPQRPFSAEARRAIGAQRRSSLGVPFLLAMSPLRVGNRSPQLDNPFG